MNLTRVDGLLWVLVAFLAVLFILQKPPHRRIFYVFSSFLQVLAGYLLIMTPWFIRNIAAFGAPFAPGTSKTLWLTSYDQLFAYPATQITLSGWLGSGLSAISRVRLWALGLNLSNMLSVQGEVILLPLVVIGFWHLRKDRRLQLAGFAWFLILAAMTIAFPFAGACGGFFHSGAAVQTVWWALAPIGLDRLVAWGVRVLSWNSSRSGAIFRAGIIAIVALITVVIVYVRVVGKGDSQGWDQEKIAYNHVKTLLVSRGMAAGSIVMVANPPGFFLVSGDPSIAIPDGNLDTLLAVASRYKAKYVVMEAGSVPNGLIPVYDNPQGWTGLEYLGESEAARVFLVQP